MTEAPWQRCNFSEGKRGLVAISFVPVDSMVSFRGRGTRTRTRTSELGGVLALFGTEFPSDRLIPHSVKTQPAGSRPRRRPRPRILQRKAPFKDRNEEGAWTARDSV